MKFPSKVMSLFIALTMLGASPMSFAACEKEQKEYDRFSSRCDIALAATGITTIAGTVVGVLLAIPTFGLSLNAGGLVGGGPGLIAKNLCRIKGEKKVNLDQCKNRVKALEAAETAGSEELKVEVTSHKEKLDELNNRYAEKVKDLTSNYLLSKQGISDRFKSEGYDLEDLSVKESIAQQEEELKQDYESDLASLQASKDTEIAQLS